MVEALPVLLGISIILFLGSFAEFLFKKIHLPDTIFLIAIGLAIGPQGFKYFDPAVIEGYAPVFTTFTLIFLLYDGAFSISLKSLARGAVKSLKVTLYNFFASVAAVTFVMILLRFDLLTSLLIGSILGGTTTAFVIPILKQMKVRGETYSVLALESAMNDVLCIVSAFTVIEVITLKSFDAQQTLSRIAELFAIAGFVGVTAGILWIVLVIKVFKENKSYMITIAYLILIYAATEFLQGNGAIAALFFGLVLKNSRDLTSMFGVIAEGGGNGKATEDVGGKYAVSVTSEAEEFFYSEISFLLKTLFFVYIGVLLDLSNTRIITIAGALAFAVMLARRTSSIIIKDFPAEDRGLITAIFARGLAAAAIAQTVVLKGLSHAQEIVEITYAFIVFTILLSSASIFFLKRREAGKETA